MSAGMPCFMLLPNRFHTCLPRKSVRTQPRPAATQVVRQKKIASFCMETWKTRRSICCRAKVRSSAMTAQAPASSAIFACSLFITSMMTSQSCATSVTIALCTSCSRKVCPKCVIHCSCITKQPTPPFSMAGKPFLTCWRNFQVESTQKKQKIEPS